MLPSVIGAIGSSSRGRPALGAIALKCADACYPNSRPHL